MCIQLARNTRNEEEFSPFGNWRQLAFAANLVATGSCETARTLLGARVPASQGRTIGGKCKSHYLRALQADYAWLSGRRDPKGLARFLEDTSVKFDELTARLSWVTRPRAFPIRDV